MVKEQVNKLMLPGTPHGGVKVDLIETHISWVLLIGNYAYKVKKPVHYSFLDFSTVEKRRFYCQREVELNTRLSDIYLAVLPVRDSNGNLFIGGETGDVIDYAVCMKRLDTARQMNVLLLKNEVSIADIVGLVGKLARFHTQTKIIYQKDLFDVASNFSDLEAERLFLNEALGEALPTDCISRAIKVSDQFIRKNMDILERRLAEGFFRDCHGDLHSRNIFLLAAPEVFDCLEFNDNYRYIDILNELAFLCMDLDSFGRQDLSDLFIRHYNQLFPVMRTDSEQMLFVYYKAYRSNVRAKVNSLRARDPSVQSGRGTALSEAKRYLLMMNSYIEILDNNC